MAPYRLMSDIGHRSESQCAPLPGEKSMAITVIWADLRDALDALA
jgi:hypothetical protein